jgi:DNA (cytosine-5)-methyltransferase 1
MNFYNEIDPFAAAWLRELIKANAIAPGVVDTRSIEDITPYELEQYTQCHFFAGIGVWSYALRQAGWPDEKPVWTGSCPCQPFSPAGEGKGFTDERHLWPAWFHLIQNQRRSIPVFGEQVEKAVRFGWLDLVQSDLEGIGYTFGSVGLPACAIGTPHQRKRRYFVSYAEREGLQGLSYNKGFSEPTKEAFAERIHSNIEQWWGLATSIGSIPIANGLTLRLAKNAIHGYGNAIVAQAAQAFIESAMEALA